MSARTVEGHGFSRADKSYYKAGFSPVVARFLDCVFFFPTKKAASEGGLIG